MVVKRSIGFFMAALLGAAAACGGASPGKEEAAKIIEATGVKGGLVVHLGCGDGTLTAALRANDSYLVQGLDADAKNIGAAREHIRSLGLYGPVAADVWAGGALPFIDNVANLVVAENAGAVSMAEIQRVLAPSGVAYVRTGEGWAKTVKPRPKEMDEWTHYLHDASNNAVAHDSLVGPPRRMQWIGGPRYSRHHDHMSAISAMVSAGGRNFYIFDEGPHASILLPPQWRLVARDAFNGTVLWKLPIEEWHTTLWPLKNGPQLLTRRLAASGDRVYVTLGLNAALSEVDAATGVTLRTFEGTGVTEEILLSDGVLFLVVNKGKEPSFNTLQAAKEAASQAWPDEAPRRIVAVSVGTGRIVWEKEGRILPGTLAIGGERVFYHDGEKIVCLDSSSGAKSWASPPMGRKSVIPSYFTPTLVAYKDLVLFSGGVDGSDFGGGVSPIFGLSAKDGKILWKGDQPQCGHHTPKDILVANGRVWFGEVAQPSDSGVITGCNPETGKIEKQFPPDTDVPWFHHRCYRAKATDKYLMFSRTGVEFIDTESGHWTPNNWVRGGCLYGIMPANGMMYAPPHPCACYTETKMYGFNALAPALATPWPVNAPDATRLARGPAFEEMGISEGGSRKGAGEIRNAEIENSKSEFRISDDWPTYRHDAARSGSTKCAVPAAGLKSVWQADLGGRLSSVVVADGKLLVSGLDDNSVRALDAETGKAVWQFTAGGRVDSAPTVWEGRVLFGCADGRVYCLRASDGALAWQYLAAPEDRRMVAWDRVESVWPVPGSTLVNNGIVYCVAGRSMFLDGGLRLLRLDAKTGRKISETVLDDSVPGTKENLQSEATGMNMPVGLPDILSCDGRYVYMRSLPFDLEGKRKFVEYVPVKDQQGDDVHLFSPTGFLDDTMWHRTYWVYGRAWASGAGGYYLAGRAVPAGRMMVFDDDTVWGYGRRWQFYRWSTPYVNHLFATAKQPEVLKMADTPKAKKGRDGKKKGNMGGLPATRFAYEWSDNLPVQVIAMVHAGPTLFVAGPQDFLNEEDASKAMDDPQVRQKLADQDAAFAGRKGAILTAVSAADGKDAVSYRLASMPVFDGMAAALGRLYLSTTDGKVLCLGEGAGTPLPVAADVNAAPRVGEDKPPEEAAAAKAAEPTLEMAASEMASHPDFQHVESASVTSGGLGYKVAVAGKLGVALKELPAPITGRATFKLKARALAEAGRLQTAFLAFGDGTAASRLVECGFRVRAKKALIAEGGAGKDGTIEQAFECPKDQAVDVEVAVDLAAGTVKMTLPGTTLEAKLKRPMKSISHAGYSVHNGVTEFSPIEISGN